MEDPIRSLNSQVDFACLIEILHEDGHLLEIDYALRWISILILGFILIIFKHSLI